MKFKTLFSIFIISATVGFAQVPNYVPTNGLVGWYPFNGNANDESGNGNNGIVNGATLAMDRFGNTNSAYSFDGSSSYITVTNANLSLTDTFSISSWVNINDLSPYYYDEPIISQWVGQNASQRKFLLTYRSVLWEKGMSFYLCDNSNITTQYSNIYETEQQSTWYHVVSVFAPGKYVKIYLNSILSYIDTTNIPSVLSPPTNSQIEIGHAYKVSGDLWFNGEIDDIGIWNRALTQQEITQLYTSSQQTALVPTLNEWGLITLAILVLGAGVFFVRQRVV